MNEQSFNRDLPVRLTEERRELYGKLLANKVNEHTLLSEQKKAAAAAYAPKLKANSLEQSRLALAIANGEELQPVPCMERWHAGTIEVVRLDTNVVIDSRPANDEDAQTGIPGIDEEPGVRDPADGLGIVRDATEAKAGEVVPSSSGAHVFVGAGGPEEAEADQNGGDEKPRKGKTKK